MPQLADLPSVETVEPVGGADVQQYVTNVRLQDQAIYYEGANTDREVVGQMRRRSQP